MKKKPTPMDEHREGIENLYDKYADTYNSDFIPPTYDTSRTALAFCNDITLHFLKKYLPADESAILADVGGGDGYWTEKLIELGYFNLTLTDLSKKMINQAKNRLNQYSKHISELGGEIHYEKADICQMNSISTASFDFVMSLYDPVSYSLNPKQAMVELARIARSNSIVIVSLDTKFRRVPELIAAGQIEAAQYLLESNLSFDFQHPQYNLTWEELSQHFENAGLEVLEIVGAPVFVHQVPEDILAKFEKDPYIRQSLLDMELEYCTNTSLVNNAGHLMMVGRKYQ